MLFRSETKYASKKALEVLKQKPNIYFLGLPFLFMYNVLSAMFNALGRSKVPLYLLIFSSVLNVGLDQMCIRDRQ